MKLIGVNRLQLQAGRNGWRIMPTVGMPTTRALINAKMIDPWRLLMPFDVSCSRIAGQRDTTLAYARRPGWTAAFLGHADYPITIHITILDLCNLKLLN
jgi:hypothetical protein